MLCLLCLIFAAVAEAGDNPDIQIFLEFENGQNYIEPAEWVQFSVYVCLENLGPGGGLTGAGLKFNRTFSGFEVSQTAVPVSWLSFGDPELEGWSIGGPCVTPDPSGIVVAGRVDYLYTGTPGIIELLPSDIDDNTATDCSGGLDYWCVRSAPSGHGGVWMFPPPGDCEEPEPPGSGWPHDPAENLLISAGDGYSRFPGVIPDGAGGAIIVWTTTPGLGDEDIYSQRVDARGRLLWATEGVPVCTESGGQRGARPATDGSGGAIFAWTDRRVAESDIYAQRVDASGTPQWTTNGVAVCAAEDFQSRSQTVSDGAGGAFIAWADDRSGDTDIYVQRIDASGVPQWMADGVLICGQPGTQTASLPVSDGSGGVIIAWRDRRGDDSDVYVQRIDASGNAQWTADGVAVCTAIGTQWELDAVPDGAGGAIIVWADERRGDNLEDIYAQRVDPSGATLWAEDGIVVLTNPSDGLPYQNMVTDGAGGAIITWIDWRGPGGPGYRIYAQRVDTNGNVMWTENGEPVCTSPSVGGFPNLATDGAGGAVIAWGDDRNGVDVNIYAQRVNASGEGLWALDGVAICTAPEYQSSPDICSDEAGGAIVAWEDNRAGQRVERNGYLGYPSATITSVTDRPNDQGGVAIVDWAASYLDRYPNEVVTYYSVWMRRTEDPPASRLPAGPSAVLDDRIAVSLEGVGAMDRFGWAPVDTVNAYYLPEYALHVPTYGDSTESGIPLTEYMVIAHTADQWVLWDSEVESGYSVDNLEPGAPVELVAQPEQTDVELRWSPSGFQDDDLSHYNIYRGDVTGFIPDESTFIDATADTFYLDVEPGRTTWYYVVAAEDAHGNVGPPSNEASAEVLTSVEEPVAPMAFALRGSRPNPFSGRTSVAFDVPTGGGEVRIEVYDVSGRRVRVLVEGPESAGRRMVAWDGSDEGGRRVASGVYYCRMKAGTYEETIKMTLIR